MTGQSTGSPLRGVVLVLLAVFSFALADVLTKHLAMLYPVSVVVAVRYIVNLALLVAIFLPKHGKALWKTDKTGLVLLRGLCLALSSLTMGLALKVMPVGETVAIIYLSPFAVMLLAAPLLGEKVSLAGWIGATTGFCGVLLILRPGGGLDPFGVAFSLINAGLATGYHLLTRSLARSETMVSMLFHVALVGTVFFIAMALPELGMAMPAALDWVMMAMLGALATIGHILFTAAYREAPASMLAPVNYFHLVWAALLGWLVFAHVPDIISLAGMAMVCLAGAGIALMAHFAHRATMA